MIRYNFKLLTIRYGVVANIIASHAIARGSIPRVGIFLLCFVCFITLNLGTVASGETHISQVKD